MEYIYSKIDNSLLHMIVRSSDIDNRINLSTDDKFLQCAGLRMKEGTTFRPHKHIMRKVEHENYIPQESWVVIKGSVKCIFYDLDDTIITEPILHTGDASFTYNGGHNYLILEDDTLVYEYKTGPYEGIEKDKKMI